MKIRVESKSENYHYVIFEDYTPPLVVTFNRTQLLKFKEFLDDKKDKLERIQSEEEAMIWMQDLVNKIKDDGEK